MNTFDQLFQEHIEEINLNELRESSFRHGIPEGSGIRQLCYMVDPVILLSHL
jgi:hypothetical protein